MALSFQSPRSYQPSNSLLGRALSKMSGSDDRLRDEALFIVAATGLGLGLLLSQYLGWTLLRPLLPTSAWTWWSFWGSQVALAGLVAGIALVGFRPEVHVTCTATAIDLQQGDRSRSIPYEAIDRVDLIPALQYHRHYRRYAATEAFLSKRPEEVILLRTTNGPVVTALPTDTEQSALIEHLNAARTEPRQPAVQPDR